MPSHIKKAGIALIFSWIFSLLAVYFDGLAFEALSFKNPSILVTNLIWTAVMVWILWDLQKGKNIKLTLIMVGTVMLASMVWDLLEFGLSTATWFYALEFVMFLLAYVFIRLGEGKKSGTSH